MSFELPKLPYALDALEPHISKATLEYHYGKHHQAYVNNLNGLVEGTEFKGKDLESIVKESKGGIFNNAAQIWNHTFYFMSFSPDGPRTPQGALAKAIEEEWGSFDVFKETFSKAGATLFGSGWVWLVKNSSGKLEIIQEENAGNPLTDGFTPILTCDVWEHAYYLDTQNARPAYLKNYWEVLDWNKIGERF